MAYEVTFSRAGFWRGVWRSLPLAAGLAPFGFVTGLVTQHHGFSLVECVAMNALVYAGASQLVAMANWTHPAPILAAGFAALVVNMRFALMGPALSPWLNGLKPGLRYACLALLVDHPWAVSVADIRNGGRDAALFLGLAVPLWIMWQIAVTAGFLCASGLDLPPHHPLYFGALAAFIALLVPLWRSRADALPWAVAALASVLIAYLLPHTSWYIVAGAICGCTAGGLLERRHE